MGQELGPRDCSMSLCRPGLAVWLDRHLALIVAGFGPAYNGCHTRSCAVLRYEPAEDSPCTMSLRSRDT